MKTLSPKIQILVDKLKLAEEIYKKAASRIHNKPMTDQLSLIATKKAQYITELSIQLGEDFKKHQLTIPERIRLELEKAEIELNHILIHRNERDMLHFCIHREEELIQSYKEVILDFRMKKEKTTTFVSHLEESKRLLEELRETRKAYVFDKHS